MLLNPANAIYQEWWIITYSCLEWYSQSKSIWDTTRVVIGGFEHPSASVLCGIADCGALVLRPTVGSMRLLASRVLECAEGDTPLCHRVAGFFGHPRSRCCRVVSFGMLDH